MSKDKARTGATIDGEIERAVEMAALRQSDVNFCHLLKTLEGHCCGTVLVNEVLEKVARLARARGVGINVGALE
jgi:hypothetical protein